VTTRFPVDAPMERVIATLEHLGFQVVRKGNHIGMLIERADGTRTPVSIPNHRRIKGSTLRRILTHAGIPRDKFLAIYQKI
jgi:predicted RNA binding protein YcfA (HicA-like mRNA interferase family)